jgi:hypothetical protein|tara:strand:+ start:356 stop:541 length:186 start_codon:yes stop_codon:yes gene_type:complete
LRKVLTLYRLSLGQARQEEVIEYLLGKNLEDEEVSELVMNLSPYFKSLDYKRKRKPKRDRS